ncbi:hypothetical protein AVEN_98968-1 [Araneus ventricosus]|uniref:Uncharacterized protein n=1 Tax=Araneus ventricosus TaxID=182803 RepID=A0A4Y2F469_ARAVE|nr:hypothetical protein AVEN_98968-1 [Araneus ventricosus]
MAAIKEGLYPQTRHPVEPKIGFHVGRQNIKKEKKAKFSLVLEAAPHTLTFGIDLGPTRGLGCICGFLSLKESEEV